MAEWPLISTLTLAAKRIDQIVKSAQTAVAAVGRVQSAIEKAGADKFASTVSKIGEMGGPFAGFGDDSATGAGLLASLEKLIREETASRANHLSPAAYAALEDSIKKQTALVRDFMGDAGRDFTREKYTRYVNAKDAGASHADAANAAGVDVNAIGDAITKAVTSKWLGSGSAGIGIGGAFPGGVMPSGGGAYQQLPPENRMTSLDLTAKELDRKLEVENQKVQAIKDTIDKTNDALTDGQQKLDDMAEAAGVTEKGGVGEGAKRINDQLAEARDKLQHLQDLIDDHALGAPSTSDIAEQQKIVVDLTKQQVAAARDLRIVTYDFVHSDAYKAQQQAIADEKARLETEKKQLADEEAKQKIAQTYHDDQMKQIEDARRALGDAANGVTAGAQALTQAGKNVESTTTQSTKKIVAAASAIVEASTTAAKTIAAVVGSQSVKPGNGMPVHSGGSSKQPTIGEMVAAGQV